MDTSNKTLAQVISSQNTQQGQSQDKQRNESFDTFVKVFSSNLSHRYPDVSQLDLNSIDYNDVKSIAEFSAACSSIALETWQELRSEKQQGRQFRRAV